MAIDSKSLTLAGLTPAALYDHLQGSGLNSVDAGILVGSWIYQNFGAGPRTFNYGEALAPAEPACAPQFVRSFHHADWVDGESVVQAQQSAGEDGFNVRFHNVENDLDSMGRDVAKAFSCLAELRSELADRLSELKNEINRIDADIFKLQGGKTTATSPVWSGPYFGGLVNSPNFLGATKLGDTSVTMWQGPQGVMMLPGVLPIAGDPTADKGIQNASQFTKLVTDSPDIQAAYAGKQVPVQDLIDKFGTKVLGNGATLAQALADVPAGATFASINDVSDALGQTAAGALRSHPGVADIFSAALQTDAGATLGTAAITQLSTLSPDTQNALSKAGFTTIASVASADPAKLAEALKTANVTATAGDVAAITSTAKTIGMISASKTVFAQNIVHT